MVRPRVLIVSQVYVPDPAAVGQHMHDLARALVAHGAEVHVIASANGYADPRQRYPRDEVRDGVQIRRLPLSSFGKGGIAVRLAGGVSFLAQASLGGLRLPRVDHVVVTTSPPMAGVLGVALARMRRASLFYWVMDINPDQVVRTGRMAPGAPAVRSFEAMNRLILAAADRVVTLDEYMRRTLLDKGADAARVEVLPPWQPIETPARPLPHADNPFRREQGWGDRFVLMYSGNLSPVHPVRTVVEAVARLRDDPRLLLSFVGGGNGLPQVRRLVEQHGLDNVRFLPYQPLERLHQSLSAADAHLVSMGDEMVGVVHPSKIYGAMAVGRPVLFLGPEHCHVGDLLQRHQCGLHVEHGDVEGAVRAITALLDMPAQQREQLGLRAQGGAREHDTERVQQRLCELIVGPR
jgi:colanic acid biosynthesis glycosyl transferase WcaI